MFQFVPYKNTKIHFNIQGKGDAIVLLHGFLENLQIWDALVPSLIVKNQIISIDLLGHGLTDGVADIHTMEDMASAVKTVLVSLKIKKVVIIGHSMGGYVSLAFTKLYRDYVKGLVLVNSTFEKDTEEKKRNRDRAIEAVNYNYKTFIRVSILNLFSKSNNTIFQKEIDKLVDRALIMSPKNIIAAIMGMKQRKDSTNLILENSEIKKMIISGKNDQVIDTNRLIDVLSKTYVNHIVVDGGHMSFIEDYSVFSYKFVYFIENL